MPSTRAIAFGLSLLFHSAAGVGYWEWHLHHRTTQADLTGFQPTELAIMIVTEEPAMPVAPARTSGEIVMTQDAPPVPVTPQPDLVPKLMPLEEQVSAKIPTAPPPEIIPVTANEPAPTVPTPAVSGPKTPATAAPENIAAGAHLSAPARQFETSVGEKSDSYSGFVGYRRSPTFKYPDLARTRRWEGTVLLLVRFSPDGTPVEVKVKESSGHAVLDESAVADQRKSEGRINKETAGSIVEVLQPVHFQLKTVNAR